MLAILETQECFPERMTNKKGSIGFDVYDVIKPLHQIVVKIVAIKGRIDANDLCRREVTSTEIGHYFAYFSVN